MNEWKVIDPEKRGNKTLLKGGKAVLVSTRLTDIYDYLLENMQRGDNYIESWPVHGENDDTDVFDYSGFLEMYDQYLDGSAGGLDEC